MTNFQREQIDVAAERAVLAAAHTPGRYVDPRDAFGEIRALARTAGAEVVGELSQRLGHIDSHTCLGKGKVDELAALVAATGATVVIFDNDLSPVQIRAIEQRTQCKVVDRSELILEIFASRATTHAARLQVEIAQLEYTFPRLRAMWSHLEQIVGGAPVGIGTRGPGETQLETDRRLAKQRLGGLRRELDRVQRRKSREVEQRRGDFFTVGLVGYTNAGKSTLFNRLTAGGAYAHEKLFSTLSTRVQRWDLGGGDEVMLSDTVGFIRDLPHHLVASFRSTLEETVTAHVLVVLVDVSDPNASMHVDVVNRTLDEIGATEQPRVLVLNKVDRLEGEAALAGWLERYAGAVPLSAATGRGTEDLASVVRGHLRGAARELEVSADVTDGRTLALLERRCEVLERRYHDGTVDMRVRVGPRQVQELLAGGARVRINGLEPQEALRREWGARPPFVLREVSGP
jgi:GTP-binding protein HflX